MVIGQFGGFIVWSLTKQENKKCTRFQDTTTAIRTQAKVKSGKLLNDSNDESRKHILIDTVINSRKRYSINTMSVKSWRNTTRWNVKRYAWSYETLNVSRRKVSKDEYEPVGWCDGVQNISRSEYCIHIEIFTFLFDGKLRRFLWHISRYAGIKEGGTNINHNQRIQHWFNRQLSARKKRSLMLWRTIR